MEMEKLVLLLVGGVIGFIASIAKDYFVEKTKKKIKENELKRNKLEELYMEVVKWFSFSSLSYVNFINNTGNLGLLEAKRKFDYDLIKIEMIISIYSETLIKDYNEIISQMHKLDKLEENDKYTNLYHDFCNLSENFKKKIVQKIKDI
jgi:hypothetical protein